MTSPYSVNVPGFSQPAVDTSRDSYQGVGPFVVSIDDLDSGQVHGSAQLPNPPRASGIFPSGGGASVQTQPARHSAFMGNLDDEGAQESRLQKPLGGFLLGANQVQVVGSSSAPYSSVQRQDAPSYGSQPPVVTPQVTSLPAAAAEPSPSDSISVEGGSSLTTSSVQDNSGGAPIPLPPPLPGTSSQNPYFNNQMSSAPRYTESYSSKDQKRYAVILEENHNDQGSESSKGSGKHTKKHTRSGSSSSSSSSSSSKSSSSDESA